MITEKSCGAIVYTADSGNLQFVIIRSKEGIYGFPKGHAEGEETEEETALREILEETGLSVTLIPGFKECSCYEFDRNGEKRQKQVVYFLGSYTNQILKAQEEEISSICLAEYERAMELLQFSDTRGILKRARDFLNKR